MTQALDGSPSKQPVALLMADANQGLREQKTKLSKSWLLRVINAREQYSDSRPFGSLETLEKYAEDTYSTLNYLSLQALPQASMVADHVASHIGKASGIVAVLRGLPLVAFPPPPNHHSSSGALGGSLERGKQGVVPLPLDVMARAGVREEDVFRQGASATGLRDAVFEVATRASDHLITARQMIKNVQKGHEVGHPFEHQEPGRMYDETSSIVKQQQELEQSFSLMMPAITTSLWLDRLQRYDFDVFRPELRVRDWRLPFKAWWSFRQRRI